MNLTSLKCGVAAAALSAMLAASPAGAQSAPSDFTTGFRYDAKGRQTGSISPDPDGSGPLAFAAVRNSYDAAGRLVKVETGELSSWQSEAVAPASWSGFSVFRTVDTQYNALDRKVKEVVTGTGGNGAAVTPLVTQFGYGLDGRLKCTAVRMNPAAYSSLPDACALGPQGSDGPDRITRHVYDAAGQLVQSWEGFGTSEAAAEATRSYDGNGQPRLVVDAKGNKAELRYDGHGRLERWVFPSAAGPSSYNPSTPESALASAGALNEGDYEAYGSDANGNRVSLRKRDGSVLTYQYDALNRLAVKVVPERSGLDPVHTRDVYYEYDLRGLQTRARFDSLSGEGVSSAYDGFGRLVSSTTAMVGASWTLAAQYDRDGNRIELSWPDTARTSFSYDGLDRMKEVLEGAVGSTTVLATIGYDRRGLRASLSRRGGDATAYAYDGTFRLASLDDAFAGGGNGTSAFGFNPASQIVSLGRSNDAYAASLTNGTRNYAVDGLNRYTGAGAAAYAHDANGNLASDGSTTFGYDVENRMVSASGARSAQLLYDPAGRLFQLSGGAAGTVRFLHDGDELVAEYAGSGALLRRYVHGAGVDDPLVWYEGAGLSDARSLHADHQGSIVSIAAANGALSVINRYDEYGVPAETNQGRFQYTGQIWLPEVGRFHYKARSYNPKDGRFDQTDPVGYDDQINLYTYVGNDPVNKTDPTGEYESHWILRAVVPGQVAWDDAVSAYQQGRYAAAAGNAARMLGEQVLVVATLGESRAVLSTAQLSQSVNAARAASLGKTVTQLERGAATKLQRAAEHEAKAAAFARNPTVRPGMEGQSMERIANQQARRIEHLKAEAREFRKQAGEDLAAARRLRAEKDDILRK